MVEVMSPVPTTELAEVAEVLSSMVPGPTNRARVAASRKT